MKELSIFALAVAAAISTGAFADGAEETLLDRNVEINKMEHKKAKLHIQAEMAKSLKEMKDAGFFVDQDGVPLGITDMAGYAKNLSTMSVAQKGQPTDPNDPFAGADPASQMQGNQGLFGNAAFNMPMNPPTPVPPPVQPVSPTQGGAVDVVQKPSTAEKTEGKQILRLVETRGQSAIFFLNDGFKEVKVGEKIYDMKVANIGSGTASLSGKNGTRLVRIDWTKPVRYSDN
ncbi:hypothetical protein [Pseudomonas syringae]|uniref:hypothetical protein n=1 Tax=Pseudomonas syringae TaxID=317 RepID=UPI001F3E53D6|nr:hypothetical protein [Pseudomonas syringae]MCF5371291.1 hypothetical protein [Pseudomonas syringae]MCF5382112.1 hypothetical protein [Pseudomonas syringae]MCF5422941.1 hypothetical protein [Pseudomonas syringae]MCF5455014.1 hypothetical protein [Pseudomonas syringae]